MGMLDEVQRVFDNLPDGLRGFFTAKSTPLDITGGVEASYLKYGVMGSLKFDGDGKLVCRVCQLVISGDQLGR